MNDIQVIVWLFPILFIFHDFEEIIFMQTWIFKNKHYLADRFPVLSKRLLPHFENITTASFTLGVAEEFILIGVVTYISYMVNSYNLWVGLFIAFTAHLLMHCFQALIIRRYVPAVVTSIICLPVCVYIISQIIHVSTLGTIVFYSVFGIIILISNLIVIHKLMDTFSKWLTK